MVSNNMISGISSFLFQHVSVSFLYLLLSLSLRYDRRIYIYESLELNCILSRIRIKGKQYIFLKTTERETTSNYKYNYAYI